MPQGSLSASFGSAGELTRAMRREHAKAGWEVDEPTAYPRLFGMRLPERRVTAAHVQRATLALRAVERLAVERDPEPETGVRASPLPVERGPGIVVLN